jgi:hypothetical protein
MTNRPSPSNRRVLSMAMNDSPWLSRWNGGSVRSGAVRVDVDGLSAR